MQISRPSSAVSQQIQSFKDQGYSHLDASPYPEQLTLKQVQDRTDRVLSLLPGAIQKASEGNGWKTDDRYDPPTEQVAAQIDGQARRVERKNNLLIGSVAAMGLGAAGGILTGMAGLPGWVGVASAVAGFSGLGVVLWRATDLEVYGAKELRQSAEDLRQWGALS